jgi:hypothetical protein
MCNTVSSKPKPRKPKPRPKILDAMLAVAFMMCAVFLMGMNGCHADNYATSYKALSVSKNTAVSIVSSAKALHKEGMINDAQIEKLKTAYQTLQAVQSSLIVAQQAAIDAGDNPTTSARVTQVTTTLLNAMNTFVQLAIDLGVIQQQDRRINQVE